MNLTCYIVDDESHAIEVLKTFIEKTPGLVLTGSSTDPNAALFQVTGPQAPDITFLDVDMPGLSGMEFAGMAALYTKIIFTTAHPEYAIEAFEKEAFDYLLKPIRYERFLKTTLKLQKHFQQTRSAAEPDAAYFYIKGDLKGKMIRVVVNDIYFVEAAQNYIIIHFFAATQMAYLTMEEIADRLPKEYFVRIHRSFIINSRRVKSAEQGQVTLDNQVIIPLGRLYRGAMLDELNRLLVQSKRNR